MKALKPLDALLLATVLPVWTLWFAFLVWATMTGRVPWIPLEVSFGDPTQYPVVESVAWARLDNNGKSISEWVYWPAIPAKALADARLLQQKTTGPGKAEFLARLPAGL